MEQIELIALLFERALAANRRAIARRSSSNYLELLARYEELAAIILDAGLCGDYAEYVTRVATKERAA